MGSVQWAVDELVNWWRFMRGEVGGVRGLYSISSCVTVLGLEEGGDEFLQ